MSIKNIYPQAVSINNELMLLTRLDTMAHITDIYPQAVNINNELILLTRLYIMAHITNKLLIRGIDAVQQTPSGSVHELAVDEELVRELELHLVGGDLDGVVCEHRLSVSASHLDHNCLLNSKK